MAKGCEFEVLFLISHNHNCARATFHCRKSIRFIGFEQKAYYRYKANKKKITHNKIQENSLRLGKQCIFWQNDRSHTLMVEILMFPVKVCVCRSSLNKSW